MRLVIAALTFVFTFFFVQLSFAASGDSGTGADATDTVNQPYSAKVPANSSWGVETKAIKNQERELDREQANKAVGANPTKAAVNPRGDADTQTLQAARKKTSETRADTAAFTKDMKSDLLGLSERINKIRNAVVSDPRYEPYDLRTDLARLDDQWTVLHDQVNSVAKKSEPLAAGDKATLTAKLDRLQSDVSHAESRVRDEFTPQGTRVGEPPSRPTGPKAEE